MGATTLSIMTHSITTLRKKGLYVTLRISDTQHNNILPLCSVVFLFYFAECHYADCRYAECHFAECRCADCRGATEWCEMKPKPKFK